MHFDGLDFSGHVCRRKSDDHSSFDDTSLNTTDGHSPDTTDFVDILERKAEGLIVRSRWRFDGIDSIEEGFTLDDTGFSLLRPTLEPRHAG